MAAAPFPVELPAPLIADYNDQIGEGRIITKTSTGVGKRRAFWPGLKTINVSYNLTNEQFLILQVFYAATVRHGVDPFLWAAPGGGVDFLTDDSGVTLTDNSGIPFVISDAVTLLVQFAAQNPIRRSQAYTSNVSKTDVSLEVLP